MHTSVTYLNCSDAPFGHVAGTSWPTHVNGHGNQAMVQVELSLPSLFTVPRLMPPWVWCDSQSCFDNGCCPTKAVLKVRVRCAAGGPWTLPVRAALQRGCSHSPPGHSTRYTASGSYLHG
eukprot:jgi/Ulvmu1/7640/UM038_0067.1